MAGKTVLIVDDSKTARMWTQALTQELRPTWTCILAEGPHEALKEVETIPPLDGFLIDINMPVMDGFALAKRIREHYPATPIAILTANIQRANQERASSAGYSFISKPLNEDKIQDFLKKVG